MANVRDPAFWKRFSTAVHLDEEYAQRPDLKHSDSWLARQNRKRSRRTCICWAFWITFIIFVAAIVGVVVWLVQSDILQGGDGSTAVDIGDANADADAGGKDLVGRMVERSLMEVGRRMR